MQIYSAKFMRGIGGTDELLGDGTPQVALIGRSNVGKSSIINSLTAHIPVEKSTKTSKGLARTSHTPGLTQEINLYSINNGLYLLDLPGYGYAQAPGAVRERLQKLIRWYLFDSPYEQKKTILVIDANVGATENDLEMFVALKERQKNIVIVANKVDKIKKADYEEKMEKLVTIFGSEKIIPYSSEKKIGIAELTNEILE